jgi:outer membrane lipoprotein carrier protein
VKAIGLLATALVGSGPSGDPAVELARRVEGRHRASIGLTARFVQTYRSGVLGRTVVERGTLKIKPPGRMRWDYRDPEEKVFVSDGRTIYFYVPADRQVIVKEQAGEHGVAVNLLAGRGDLLSEFQPSLDDADGPPGLRRLRLTPRRPDPDVEQVLLDVDDAGRIHGIEILDAQGNSSRFRFDAVREDVRLPERIFRFEIPPGVEKVLG